MKPLDATQYHGRWHERWRSIFALLVWAVPLANGCGNESEKSPTQRAFAAVQLDDWQSALDLAIEQMGKHPEDAFWADMICLATLNIASNNVPRIRQSPAQLADAEQQQLRDLSRKVGEWLLVPAQTRKEMGAELAPEVKKFAADHADLPAAWLLQAQMMLLLDRQLEGRIAGRNLEELRSWETSDKNVLRLLAEMQSRGWLPILRAAEPQRKRLTELEDNLKKVPAGAEAKEKLAAILTEVKAFCVENPELPNGWLLQMSLASVLDRSLDEKIAQSKLAALRKPPATPTKAAP